jgi:uncharacterized protein YhfF
MTSKEKAEELIKKHNSIEHAIITVNEIIKQWEYIDAYLANLGGELNTNLNYWYEVETEIYNHIIIKI